MEQCTTQLSTAEGLGEENYRKLFEIISSHRNDPSGLIQVLHKTQQIIGYLPRDILTYVSEELNVPFAKVYGVVSFYSLFSTKPKGKHQISVCAGTACYVRGAKQLLNKLEKDYNLKPGDTTDDGLFSLDVVRCVGACGLGPVVTVDGEVYARQVPETLDGVLSQYKE